MTEAPIPPQNLDAEENVLGSLVLSKKAIDAVEAEGLKASDFYRESHGLIYQACIDLHAAGESVDAITVNDEMGKRGLLDKVGGTIRINELACLVPATASAGHWAKIVRDTATVRRLMRAGLTITRLAQDRRGEADELIAQAETALTEVVMDAGVSQAASLTEGLDQLLAEVREAYTTKVAITGNLTGYRDLDEILGGLWPGQLIILAARPSMGKSTLGLNIAENMVDAGGVVLFVSLEMSRFELQLRSLGRAAAVSSTAIANGAVMTEKDAKRLGEAVPIVQARTKLLIHDASATVATIRAEASRAMRQQSRLDAIFIDYLQLMDGAGEENRQVSIATISRGLKQLARRLEVPIVAMSQLNRNIEQRAEKRPMLSDLRESGALEQDADTVLFIHDAAAYDPDREADGTVEIIVAKQRRGRTDVVKLAFNRGHSTFKTLGRAA